MVQCLCLKSDGKRCTRDVSTKTGDDPSLCWQHQKCSTKYSGSGAQTARSQTVRAQTARAQTARAQTSRAQTVSKPDVSFLFKKKTPPKILKSKIYESLMDQGSLLMQAMGQIIDDSAEIRKQGVVLLTTAMLKITNTINQKVPEFATDGEIQKHIKAVYDGLASLSKPHSMSPIDQMTLDIMKMNKMFSKQYQLAIASEQATQKPL